jgi:PAS domain-containing protein
VQHDILFLQNEEEHSRAHQQALAVEVTFGLAIKFDMSSDNLAFIRASSDPSTIGTIESCNAGALRMFGYHSKELTGRHVGCQSLSNHGRML